ncbi:TPA: hypothetical protein ACIE7I_005120, partial [Escherichia coli]
SINAPIAPAITTPTKPTTVAGRPKAIRAEPNVKENKLRATAAGYELNGQTIYVLLLWHTRENR